MPVYTLLFTILAALVAFGIAGFQYYYGPGRTSQYPVLFTFLRFVSLFALLLLLINPTIERNQYYIEKPDLILAVDDSESIEHFGATGEVRSFIKELSENESIQERFELRYFSFGEGLEQLDSFDFREKQTNIQGALKSLDQLYKNKSAPTLLITDGNQTFGEDFRFTAANFSNPIFPVVVGDTTSYQDLLINRINVNKYAYKDNQFPVEIFVNYTGSDPVESRLEIRGPSSVLNSQEISLNGNEGSKIFEVHLPASQIGVTTYEAVVMPLVEERDTLNNIRNFAVEVIDERTSVLLVAGILHPDLGALKKSVGSNQQRELDIFQVTDSPIPDLNTYQLIILYQPNKRFSNLFGQIQQENRNYWMIMGSETDWRFLNASQDLFRKEITAQNEEFFSEVNPIFNAFQFEDIGFSQFPPLQGSFGEVTFSRSVEPLLFQQIQGIITEDPLLAVQEENNIKKAFLFGADLWKWRATSFAESGSFEEFDDFIGKLVQFLSSRQRRERLMVDHEPFYYGNDRIVLSAQYFDRNYQFDPGAELSLELTNQNTGDSQVVPFLLKQRKYEVDLSNLPSADYEYSALVAGENLSETGRFRVIEFNVEQQFSSANISGLRQISAEGSKPLYYVDDPGPVIERLLSDNSFIPVQKSRKNDVPLIDWYYLLAIIALSLSTEWFLRKYYGLI